MSIFNHRKPKSINYTLFTRFTALFIAAFILISVVFVVSENRKIHSDSFLSIEDNLNHITEGLDLMVDELNNISKSAAYSNLIKDNFAAYLGSSSSDASSSSIYMTYRNTKILYDLLFSIMGPFSSADQIYLYGLNGGEFGVGRDNSTSDRSVQDFPWYDDIRTTHGEKYIFANTDARLARYYSYDNVIFMSLCRKYYNTQNVPQGIIEVKKSLLPLFRSIDGYNRPYDEQLYIFDADGNVVYSMEDETQGQTSDASFGTDYCSIINDSSIDAQNLGSAFMKRRGSEYIIYRSSENCGFTTAAVVDRHSLLEPIYQYTFTAVIIMLLVCLAIVGLSYSISRRIGTPLGQIYGSLRSFGKNLEGLAEQDFPELDTSIIEVNALYEAFLKMQAQTRESMQRQIELQNQEMQSRMLALQAQMNPHFLYNSLSAIQAMADEGLDNEIYMLCQNMSDILRYISSDSNQLVSLADELSHTRSYMECMKARYAGQLTYTVDIPDEMSDIQLPKLCLQLIVENAIKFTTKKRSPWTIAIDGQMTDDTWELHIKDNGPGFTEEKLVELMEKIRDIDESGVLPNLEINGMGLMNIYIRFKLLYSGQHVFRLSNNDTGGASITIGGVIS